MRIWEAHSIMLRLLSLPFFALAAAASAAPADPAAGRIESYNQSLIAVMKQGPALGLKGRADRLEATVRADYAMPVIAGLVVGPKWASASAADRAALIAALTRHSAVTLAKNFKSYSGEKFSVDPASVVRGPARVVRSTIDSDRLTYLLQQSGGEWKIVDVIAGGVSQLAVQRGEFAATVTAGGPAALAKKLAEADAKAVK